MEHIPVSVIIPTYNGAKKIPLLIKALEAQTFKDFEVVVVVDGSTDNTLEVLNSLKPSFPSYKVIFQENKGRGAVRNTGAKNAAGLLLIFFDDDMLPLENCIEGHIAHHKKFKGSILTGGLREEITGSSPDILKYKAYLSNKWNKQLPGASNGLLTKSSVFITAANFSIDKNVFFELGGFDERLNDAEDFDFAVTAFRAGIPLYFNEDVFAWHNDTITCASYIKRQRQYTVAQNNLCELKPAIATDGFMKKKFQPSGWKKKVFKAFTSSFWIEVVDSERLKFLPEKFRYKLYDMIITANGIYFPEDVRIDHPVKT